MTNAIEKLSQIFREFPGIGPRQAKRFAFFLLAKDDDYLKKLGIAIYNIKREVVQCVECYRYFPPTSPIQRNKKICELCSDVNRDQSLLMILEKDIDLDNVRKAGVYNGYYFVLGGLLPILEKEPEKRIRIKELEKLINRKSKDLKEIILALSANAEGDNTMEYLKNKLRTILEVKEIKISLLGRGLSTGTELEYSDNDTLKNALKNRS
ncbi:MAG: toprim domain-containing protein [bacterium]